AAAEEQFRALTSARASSLLASLVSLVNDLIRDRGCKQRNVREHEHPVTQQPTVKSKAGGGCQLADEKPMRHTRHGFCFPLCVDLANDGRKQNETTAPSDHICTVHASFRAM